MLYKRLFYAGLFLLVFNAGRSQQIISLSTKTADSLFFLKDWKRSLNEYTRSLAREKKLIDNAIFLSRVGFCYYHTRQLIKSIEYYKKAENADPDTLLLQSLDFWLAKSYISLQGPKSAYESLSKAVKNGFANVLDLDSSQEFKKLSSNRKFTEIRNQVLDNAFPCRKDPRSRQFDFWVGEWNVYVTGTDYLVGHSIIEKKAGDCMILENWSSPRATYEGKSVNYINPTTEKWEQVWIGSEGRANNNVHRFFNGEYKDSVLRFTFETTGKNGASLDGRFSFFNEGVNRVRQLQETSADGGTTWSTVYDFTYNRKNSRHRHF